MSTFGRVRVNALETESLVTAIATARRISKDDKAPLELQVLAGAYLRVLGIVRAHATAAQTMALLPCPIEEVELDRRGAEPPR